MHMKRHACCGKNVSCFSLEIYPTNKIDNLTRVIIHDNLTCVDYHETN